MFSKKIPTNLPKVYCKVTINKNGGAIIDLYGLLAFNSVNKFLERFE